MPQSYRQPGKLLTLTAPYARATSGLGAKVGSIFGVSTGAVDNGAESVFSICGVHELAKTSAQAWAQGDPVYWDDTNKRCDTDPALGMAIGYATVAAANPTSTGLVKLAPPAPRAAAVASLTDSSGGAAANGTIEQVTDFPTVADAVKELATKLNALLAALRTAGVIAP